MYDQFKKIEKEQILKAKAFESNESFEMAYLAYWIILEKTLKIIEFYRKRSKLYESICEWKSYLEKNLGNTPAKISSFTLLEPENIPDSKIISKFIGELPLVIEIMNTQSKNGSVKWRNKRNNIAHQSDSFSDKKKYQEYKEKILSGISEIDGVLSENEA